MPHASCTTQYNVSCFLFGWWTNTYIVVVEQWTVRCCEQLNGQNAFSIAPSFVSVYFIFFFFLFYFIFVVFVGLNIQEIHNIRNHIEMPVVFKAIFGSRLFDDFLFGLFFFLSFFFNFCFFREFSFWCDDLLKIVVFWKKFVICKLKITKRKKKKRVKN